MPSLSGLLGSGLVLVCAALAGSSALARPAASAWVGSWAASQQIPEPQNALPPQDLTDATLRQIVHLSVGGTRLRVRLSNAFGTAPWRVTSVHVAVPRSPASAAIDPASDRALTFSGSAQVTIPAGAEYWSDPIDFRAAPLSSLAITLHTDVAPARETSHPGSRATTYLVHGDQVSASDLPGAKTVEHWFQVSGVDVSAPGGGASIVTLGDSITDGHGATTNGNDRWPDDLAERLQASPRAHHLAVLNEGIGGNRVLLDGLGPNALARFGRDVVGQTGVRYVIVLEGVNDLGTFTRTTPRTAAERAELVHELIGAYEQMIARAHAHGIKAIGATITPYTGSGYYHPAPADEAERQALNAWIRAPGHFDAVIDFDRAVRDPAHPDRLRPDYDSGDHLHPSPAGYRAMANAIPLGLFGPSPARTDR